MSREKTGMTRREALKAAASATAFMAAGPMLNFGRFRLFGGQAEYSARTIRLMGYFARRSGNIMTSPMAGIYGPKVMIVNESAGSGGDALPYYFKQRGLGPVVGTRTWGGLVGTLGVPATIDGGGVTAPDLAFFDLDGRWAVENEGVMPDIVVENTPAAVIAGRDPQLERAVQEALRLLEQNPAPHVARPAPIDRVSQDRAGVRTDNSNRGNR